MPEEETTIKDLGDVLLESITSLHSNAAGRQIINENFEKLQAALIVISGIVVDDLNNIILPDPPELNVQYVLQWDGDHFVFVEAETNPGTRYIIRADQVIRVLEDYQYIVHDHIYIYGELVLEGNAELVVF